jgi:L-ribulose-5-phosphate 4-epimerase
MKMLEELRSEVCRANRALVAHGLVTLTWGNVSGISTDRRHVAIKPSGVAYEELTPESIVVVDLEGEVVEGDLRPSSDTPTHLVLYRSFPGAGGVVHTHSRCATAFAQARREIPCLGTTHADHFHGPVPVTRTLDAGEVGSGYEARTGEVIVERFTGADPMAVPGVLVAGHAPFAWGPSVGSALENAVALEAVAALALATLAIDGTAPGLEAWVADLHYLRKHGDTAYYGQDR